MFEFGYAIWCLNKVSTTLQSRSRRLYTHMAAGYTNLQHKPTRRSRESKKGTKRRPVVSRKRPCRGLQCRETAVNFAEK
jgi:hypothetical protein